MTCYWFASDHPRYVRNRHTEDCDRLDCSGCQPCTEPHCLRCGRVHDEHVCPGCLADARDDLTEIRRMCAALPAEVIHRGLDSEAMNLLGPVPNPDERGQAEVAYLAGQLPEGWLETGRHGKECPLLRNEPCLGCGGTEWHPLTVLGWWATAYCEAFDHDAPARLTVAGCGSYLDRNLTYIGEWDEIPFADFARDLAKCRAHMEQVLHDGEQVEEGAPCMTCERPMRRVFGGDELPWAHRDGSRPRAGDDVWACARCREWRTEAEYRLNVASVHREKADRLAIPDLVERFGVTIQQLRQWTAPRRIYDDGAEVEIPPLLRPCGRIAGRNLYRVADVEALIA